MTEVSINALEDCSLYIFSGDSLTSLTSVLKLTSNTGMSSTTELKIEDGQTYFLVVMPENPGVKSKIPSISFSILNKTGSTTKEFAYSKGKIFLGIILILCIFTIVMSNFAIQNSISIIEPPDEELFKLQMKSYRQIGNVWDPEDE